MLIRVTHVPALVAILCFTVSNARAATLNVPGDHATIQACIDAAVSGVDECVVAPGTYTEAINFNGKAIALRSSGGAAVTTIDGNGAIHVVQCVTGEGADTILDGFTITGGAATGGFPDFAGGGMYNFGSNPTVTNCTFSGNSALSGGGMYNNVSSPTVSNCTFSGNTTNDSGAGMYNDGSSPVVTNCTFIGNMGGGSGGGMANCGRCRNSQVSSFPTVANCTFRGNTAGSHGGGIWILTAGLTITNCTFIGNSASFDGGGMYDGGLSTVTNCVFIGNSASFGGGMRMDGRFTAVTNCTFSANASSNSGGGMFNQGSFNSTVTNCTFSGNTAGSGGGGMHNANSFPAVTNCILWGNSPVEILNSNGGIPTVSLSNVRLGLPAGTIDGGGNIDADPLFANADGSDNIPGTDDDDLRLQITSPGIDAGDNTALNIVGILTDLDGNDRFSDVRGVIDTGIGTLPIVDMGAYEFQGGIPCPALSTCDDGDVCTFDECVDLTCFSVVAQYGDVDGNSSVNLFDLFCVLDGFAGDFSTCPRHAGDIEPCGGNNSLNVFDLFAILDSFNGVDPCCGGLP